MFINEKKHFLKEGIYVYICMYISVCIYKLVVKKYVTSAFYDFSCSCMLCTVYVAVLSIQTALYFFIPFAKYIIFKVET